MSNRLITGSAVALVTPFRQDGTIDTDALRRLVRFQREAGTDIVIPCGTTGESPTLTPTEQAEIIRIVLEEAGDRMMVGAHAGTNATDEAVELARNAEQAGAQVILSVAPYYNKPSQEGYYQHFAHIARAVSIPIILYNVPGRTASNVTAETIIRLATEFGNIRAVKEATDNMDQIMELIERRPEGFSVLTGEDMLILPFMALGGDGVVSVAANQVPKVVKALVEAMKSGNLEKARAINTKYRRLFKLNFIESNPVPVKYALAQMGMVEEVYRLPLVPMSDANKAILRQELQKLGLV